MKRLCVILLALTLTGVFRVPVLATASGTWDEGYEAGLADGAAGFADGDAKRYQQQVSIANGYDGGYAEGYVKGWWEAWKDRPAPSDYERGFGDGYVRGWEDGEGKLAFDRAGRAAGLTGDYRSGFLEGYDDGYSEALDEIYEYALHNWDGDFDPLEQPLIVNGWPFKGQVVLKDGVACASAKTLNEIMGTKLAGPVLPIRDAAAQAGWDVVWNKANRQVVMLNKKILLEQALSGRLGRPDPDFGALDKLLDKAAAQGFGAAGPRESEGTLTLRFSAFSTMEKGNNAALDVKLHVRSNENGFHAAASCSGAKLAELMKLMKIEGMEGLRDLPGACTLEVIRNGSDLYLSAPFLSMLDQRFAGAEWVHIALPQAGTDNDVAEALYQRLKAESKNGPDPMRAYQDFARDCVALDVLGGPESLTEKDGAFTWRVDTAKVNQALARLLGERERKLFRECALAAQLGPNGWNNLTLSFRPDTDQMAALLAGDASKLEKTALSWLTNLFDVRVSAKASGGPGGVDGTAELHWKNSFRLTAALDLNHAPCEDFTLPKPAAADYNILTFGKTK